MVAGWLLRDGCERCDLRRERRELEGGDIVSASYLGLTR